MILLQEELYDEVLGKIDIAASPTDEELKEIIFEVIRNRCRSQYIPLTIRISIGRSLFDSFRKLDLLQDFLDDPTITEIMVNGPQHIFIERFGILAPSEKHFSGNSKLEDVIQQIAAGSNRIVNEFSPIADARLKDGSRVNIVLPPISIDGAAVTIRKFSASPITVKNLIETDSITQEAAALLEQLVKAKYNLFISGGTGAGKTTFLNALSAYIPQKERIITIEDNAELQLLEKPNLVRLEARNSNVEGTGEVSIRDLIRTALRMRPDRIIVGEVRGIEAIDMIMAMNTGHDGSLSTGHANSPGDMLERLSTMVLMGMNIPLPAIYRQLSSGIDVIVHLGRMKDGSRKVLEIAEVCEYQEEKIRLNTLFCFKEGRLEKVGNLENSHKLEMAGCVM